MDDRLLKSKEVAQRLGISKAYAYRLMSKGAIPTVRMGTRTIRCRPEDLENYILANLHTNEYIGKDTKNINEYQPGQS